MISRKSFAQGGLFALATLFSSFAAADSSPQVLDGLWSGEFDIKGRGPYDFTALYVGGVVSAYSVDSNVVYNGTVVGDEQAYQSNMSMFIRDGSLFGTVKLDGTVSEQATVITARYLTTGKDTGTLTLNYDPLFEREVDFAELAGLWEYLSEQLSISLSVMPTGQLEGTDSAGCNYYGTLERIRPGINALGVNLELASCSTTDGHYTGMAHVGDGKVQNDTLHLHVTGDHFGLYYPLQKIISAQ